MRKKLSISTLIFACLLVTAAKAEEVSGHLDFFTMPVSTISLRPRGASATQHWMPAVDIKVSGKHCHIFVEGRLYGGAYFDNVDQLQTEFGGQCQFGTWFARAEFFDAYALSVAIIPDPASRTRESGVNQMSFGGGKAFKFEKSDLKIGYLKAVRGNLPIFWPDGYTQPYTSHNIYSEVAHSFTKRTRILVEPDVYTTKGFDQGRLQLRLELEFPTPDKRVLVVLGGVGNLNLGATEKDTNYLLVDQVKNTGQLIAGLRIYFGNGK